MCLTSFFDKIKNKFVRSHETDEQQDSEACVKQGDTAQWENSSDFDVLALKHIGFSHLENKRPCQDNVLSSKKEKYILLSLSDGHGGSNYIRSDRGSALACKAAEEALCEFAEGLSIQKLSSERQRNEALTMVCKNILHRWNEAVKADYQKESFQESELEEVSAHYKASYERGQKVEHAYGATLIAVLLTPEYFLAIRNGDGECIIFDDDGKFWTPIPWNEKCEASVVTSLCSDNAIDDFRWFFTNKLPAAVFLSSDGVDNSYPEQEELYDLYGSIIQEYQSCGLESVTRELEEFLPLLSEKGSQDDVSLAAIFHKHKIAELKETLDLRQESRNSQKEKEHQERLQKRLDAEQKVQKIEL